MVVMMTAGSSLWTTALLMRQPACARIGHQFSSLSRRRGGTSIQAMTAGDAVDVLEQQAVAASEAWDTAVTAFMDADIAAAAEKRLEGQDVGLIKVGGYPNASRQRFVFTNPELLDSLDESDLAAEHAVLLRVSVAFDKKGNQFGAGGKKLPNLLDGIGVDFEQLGDVTFDEGKGGEGGVAHVVCDPSVQKTIERLLPKSLGRASIEAAEPGSAPTGTLVEMVVARLDKRDYK
jgi:RNA-binding protein YlmH